MKIYLRKLAFTVSEKYDGKNVLSVLINEGTSKRLIAKLKQIPNGITKNGTHTKTIDNVNTGDIIEITLEDKKVLTANKSLSVPIVYEDEDVIVFDKPAFMPVHPSHNHLEDTLGNFFSAHCEGLSYRPINRLDRNTSGLCVVAKNSYSALILQKSISKTYYAVARGIITEDGTIDAPIARESDSIITRCVSQTGQRAITHYKVLLNTNNNTLLEITLETGRTHQIRVHFSFLGNPLAGDDMYGGSTNDINRQALHCGQLKFTHPITSQIIELKAPIPKDMETLLKI